MFLLLLQATTLYCLVLEYASGGDLFTYIRSQERSRLLDGQARIFVRQLVSALHYFHDKNVVHRLVRMHFIMQSTSALNYTI